MGTDHEAFTEGVSPRFLKTVLRKSCELQGAKEARVRAVFRYRAVARAHPSRNVPAVSGLRQRLPCVDGLDPLRLTRVCGLIGAQGRSAVFYTRGWSRAALVTRAGETEVRRSKK